MPRKEVFNSIFTIAENEDWLPTALDTSDGKFQLPEFSKMKESEMGKKMHVTMGETELDREAYMISILAEYQEFLSRKSKTHLGYPVTSYSDYHDGLAPFLRYYINNTGDPFFSGNYAIHSRQFETAVLDWFAKLWEIEDDEFWGYITNGGTEGNLHGLLLGREIFPSGVLYTSRESHYSIFKAARMFRMECEIVGTLLSGEIDLADLNARLLRNKDKPAIVNVNIGTTFKGALDDLDLVIETLHKCGFTNERFYIHCDAALSGILISFLKYATKISFKKPIGSVSVSGHKFLGCPMPCGVQITRKKHISVLSTSIEYIGTADATISGSRNGHSPIFLWYIIKKKGYIGIKEDVQKCLTNAHYLANRLRKAGISTMLNKSSITVIFERPQDHDFVLKWQLSCVGNMAHIVVLPKITIAIIDDFCDDLLQRRLIWHKKGIISPLCVATDMGDKNCCCMYHKVVGEMFF